MRVRLAAITIAFVALPMGASLGQTDKAAGAYTLYRNTPIDPSMRIHVATFDASDGARYNEDNCTISAKLFAAQLGVVVRYWCENGQYRR